MIVCIAEKPSVARDIANILGAKKKYEGYYEGCGYQVTWALGHLCRLKEPHDYSKNWQKWSLDVLPMVPQRFGIKLIDDAGTKKQFEIIKKLISSAEEIINCGDAGQEGELIQRWIMQYSNAKCPVKRLWISSLTEEAIRDGFRHLSDQSKYNNLYLAGLSRACGDWLLGINATRLYTLKYGRNKQVLSIGRVQTPTLALIVQRDNEIKNFHPEPYWVLQTKYKGVLFTSTKGKFTVKQEADKVYCSVLDKPFIVIDIYKKQGREPCKQLYDLTALQVDCNKKFGFSADQTLKTIQSLYEKKLTTYPRVDTRYLSDDIYPKCNDILHKVLQAFDTDIVKRIGENLPMLLPKSKRVFDSSKVTDHHAIIPTGIKPGDLTYYEEKVYSLIVRSFISVFLPDCKYSTTTVIGRVENNEFKVSGKEITSMGWRILYDDNKQDEDIEDKENQEERILPHFEKGESGDHRPILQSKMSTPPKPYTEATLLQAMETAGKFVENEELKILMKENGIGRPSSRASIIETLFTRNYIIRQKKNLSATITGHQLIDIIKDDLLKSCELTGIWEKKLRDIEKGTYDAAKFIEELKEQLQIIVNTVKSDKSQTYVTTINQSVTNSNREKNKKSSNTKYSKKNTSTTSPTTSKSVKVKQNQACPLCGKGYVIKGKYSYFCNRHNEGCKFKAPL